MRVQPWRSGTCEAGVIGMRFEWLGSCDRRGSWMVNGTILCGTCKRRVMKNLPANSDIQAAGDLDEGPAGP